MKILILQYYSYPDAYGGAWKYSFEVGRRLAARGHEVHLVTCKPAPALPDEEILDGVRFYRIGTEAARSPFGLWREMRYWVRRIRVHGRPDCVHVHNPLVGFLASFVPGLWGVPRVYHMHSLWYDEEKVNDSGRAGNTTASLWLSLRLLAIRLIEWHCFFWARRVLMLSEYSRKVFDRYYPLPKQAITVIPGGVDTEEFRPAASETERAAIRAGLGWGENVPVLLTVRRLEPRMGIDLLLKAAGLLKTSAPEIPFRVCVGGEGSMKTQWTALTRELDLQDRVDWAGKVASEKLPLYYRAADAFVLPTLAIEGFGLATVEAMASGLPVFGTPIGATPELLRPMEPRLLFDAVTPDAMANRLEEFLRDPAVFRSLGSTLRRTAKNRYEWKQVVDAVEAELFKSLRS